MAFKTDHFNPNCCSFVSVKEQYAILKELYSFRGPGPDADEVRSCIYAHVSVKAQLKAKKHHAKMSRALFCLICVPGDERLLPQSFLEKCPCIDK